MTSFQYWLLIAVIWACTALIGNEIRTAINCLKDIESSVDSLRTDEPEET